jgi:hypothetical protein
MENRIRRTSSAERIFDEEPGNTEFAIRAQSDAVGSGQQDIPAKRHECAHDAYVEDEPTASANPKNAVPLAASTVQIPKTHQN